MTAHSRLFRNPLRRDGAGFAPQELADVLTFAQDRPATPLVDAAAIASSLGLSRLLIKDESARWGLNAFKITGASYALDRWRGADGVERLDGSRRLICASAGNHGRAVARAARERGLPCQVFLPADALRSRVDAIRSEGADVVQIDGTYEDALARAGEAARAPHTLLVSDTSQPDNASAMQKTPGIPDLIVRGYTRVFAEAAAAWDAPPDVIVVQGGVGGLVAAAAGWMRTMLPDAVLVAAEPDGAACLMESARAGRLITLPSTRPTSMVTLRCAEPSASAWPFVAAGVDAFVAVTDDEAAQTVRALKSEAGIDSGASGACGLAALTAVAEEFAGRSAMIVVTEGS